MGTFESAISMAKEKYQFDMTFVGSFGNKRKATVVVSSETAIRALRRVIDCEEIKSLTNLGYQLETINHRVIKEEIFVRL